jgi:hypothetical protein
VERSADGLTTLMASVLGTVARKQAEEQKTAGSAWNDSGGLVFVSRWGQPLYPDTVTAFMTKLIRVYNDTDPVRCRGCRTLGCTICGICTPRPCCWPEFRYTSSLQALATLIQL